jgi:hypothetical protein
MWCCLCCNPFTFSFAATSFKHFFLQNPYPKGGGLHTRVVPTGIALMDGATRYVKHIYDHDWVIWTRLLMLVPIDVDR